jgi:hypothetical protein
MERELSDIQDPFVYLEELDRKASRVLRQGESLVSNGDWEILPEYGEEIKQIVKEFERVVPLLEETHERILADQRRREQERFAEEERQRKQREERLKRESEYEQAIATFRISYSAFQTKAIWKTVNDALVAGEAVELNPLPPSIRRSLKGLGHANKCEDKACNAGQNKSGGTPQR